MKLLGVSDLFVSLTVYVIDISDVGVVTTATALDLEFVRFAMLVVQSMGVVVGDLFFRMH